MSRPHYPICTRTGNRAAPWRAAHEDGATTGCHNSSLLASPSSELWVCNRFPQTRSNLMYLYICADKNTWGQRSHVNLWLCFGNALRHKHNRAEASCCRPTHTMVALAWASPLPPPSCPDLGCPNGDSTLVVCAPCLPTRLSQREAQACLSTARAVVSKP